MMWWHIINGSVVLWLLRFSLFWLKQRWTGLHINVPTDFVVVILARLFELIHFCTLFPKHWYIITDQIQNWCFSFSFCNRRVFELSSLGYGVDVSMSINLEWREKRIVERFADKSEVRPIQTKFYANHWTEAEWTKKRKNTWTCRCQAPQQRIFNAWTCAYASWWS